MPRVSAMVKFCSSCDAEWPLTGDGARRARLIMALGERDGWHCRYCRVPLVPDSDPKAGTGGKGVHVSLATVEHVVPVCMGGGNRRENLALACTWCNNKKGDRPEGWLRTQPGFLARRVEVHRRFGGDPWEHAMNLLDLVAASRLWFGRLPGSTLRRGWWVDSAGADQGGGASPGPPGGPPPVPPVPPPGPVEGGARGPALGVESGPSREGPVP